ncbi:MAG TPA: hypothetical protein VEL28_03470 [Candidatus Binatia bacterium]|nr:hypothetical protein [Candidatus Binatia bacterium]
MSQEQPTAAGSEWRSNVMAGLCLLTLVVSLVRDLFIPETRNVEVWFGFEVTGTAALVTAPIHWAIFATGAWAFWSRKPWIWPAAAGYLLYGAFAHLVWSEASANGRGWMIGLVQAFAISTMAMLVLRMRPPHRHP